MALFSRAPKVETPPAEPVEPTAAQQQEQLATVISQSIVTALAPLLQQRAEPRPEPQPPEPEPEPDEDPETTAKLTKIASRIYQQQSQPYAHIFESALPSVVRHQVVNNLSQGQSIIYKKYEKEVDAAIAAATRQNPAAAANPEVHRKAIALVLGEHSDEIEQLVINRLTPEDLPKTFAFPNSNKQDEVKFQPTELQTQQRDSYNIANPRGGWTEEMVDYYSNFKPGSWSDIVQQHREKQAALRGEK